MRWCDNDDNVLMLLWLYFLMMIYDSCLNFLEHMFHVWSVCHFFRYPFLHSQDTNPIIVDRAVAAAAPLTPVCNGQQQKRKSPKQLRTLVISSLWMYLCGVQYINLTEEAIMSYDSLYHDLVYCALSSLRCIFLAAIIHFRFSLSWFCKLNIPSQSLTRNLEMMVSKRNLLFQGAILRFYVNLPGCNLISW